MKEKCVICETIGVETEATTAIPVNGDNIPVCAACFETYETIPLSFMEKQFLADEDSQD